VQSRDLLAVDVALPEHEIVRLVSAATRRSRSDVLLGFEVTPEAASRFDAYVVRRLADEPLQYIEGSVPFGPVDLLVDPRVLVPRPETEYLFEQAAASVRDPSVIVDLCTGSGNLALALAATFRDATVYAVDLSQDAAAVANANAEHNKLDITILVGDLFDPLPCDLLGKVDLLVSNPPYLASSEVEGLPRDVLAEPRMALVAGARGDEVVQRIARDAHRWLRPGGVIVCEISEFFADRTVRHFRHLGGEIRRDLTGRDRFVIGRRGVE